MYWPGMSKDIEKIVSQCKVCVQHSPTNPKEPLIPLELPDKPWANISADIFEFENQQYVVSVDHYSKWSEVAKLPGLNSCATMQFLSPNLQEMVLTDNRPQFRDFSEEYNFVHVTSSPHFPQANGQAERTVRKSRTCCVKPKTHTKLCLIIAILILRKLACHLHRCS